MKRMFKYSIIAMCAVLILISACVKSSEGRDRNMRGEKFSMSTEDSVLIVDPDIIDFGKIKIEDGVKKNYRFYLSNHTDSIVRINKVEVSCSCVRIIHYDDSILPNSKIILEGEIDFSNQKGHVRKSIFISYNRNSVKMLKLRGDISK